LVTEGAQVVQEVFGASIYGRDDDEIGPIVVELLRARRQTLALAESCTGGAIADTVTDVPGASEVFQGGVVAYANSAKINLLGVNAETLSAQGAVSETVARELATGARTKFGSDYALGVTGLAGPGGGTETTPVGTVFIALASARGVEVRKYLNVWDRLTFKQVTAMQALAWLAAELRG
jgi:nicotinamide-nucleotide amidase